MGELLTQILVWRRSMSKNTGTIMRTSGGDVRCVVRAVPAAG
jgi:hypothetical protein